MQVLLAFLTFVVAGIIGLFIQKFSDH